MNIFSPPNRTFDGPVSTVRFDINFSTCACPGEEGWVGGGGVGEGGGWGRDLSTFKFGTFIGRFQIGILHVQSNAEYVCS